jgi:hypothetical protein
MTDNILSLQHHHHSHANCHGGKSAGPTAAVTVTPDAVPMAVSVAAADAVMTTQQKHNITEDAAAKQVAGGLFVRREDVDAVHLSSGGLAAPTPTPTHYTAAASLVDEKQPPHDPNDDSDDGSRVVG